MGFEAPRVELALKHTGGLQGALSWLETNQDTSVEDLQKKFGGAGGSTAEASSSTESDAAASSSGGADAKSYVCNDCGKLLRNWNAVQFHAEKTEHQNFDESTTEVAPLSAEEKKAKLEELKVKLAEKKRNMANEDVAENKRNNQIRRKLDKDVDDAKEQLRRREELKEVERRKQEKIDDAKARARVKAEIAATQQARREAAAKAKAEREGIAQPTSAAPPPAAPIPSAPKPAAHTEARLSFRITGRPPITKTFPADTSLFEVATNLAEEIGTDISTFTTTFPPRKAYNLQDALDSSKTLKEAGLTPSAALLVGTSD